MKERESFEKCRAALLGLEKEEEQSFNPELPAIRTKKEATIKAKMLLNRIQKADKKI